MLLQKKETKRKKIYKRKKKKKKEFFRIRKDRKRKNGANARAYVRIHIDRTARDRLPLFR